MGKVFVLLFAEGVTRWLFVMAAACMRAIFVFSATFVGFFGRVRLCVSGTFVGVFVGAFVVDVVGSAVVTNHLISSMSS